MYSLPNTVVPVFMDRFFRSVGLWNGISLLNFLAVLGSIGTAVGIYMKSYHVLVVARFLLGYLLFHTSLAFLSIFFSRIGYENMYGKLMQNLYWRTTTEFVSFSLYIYTNMTVGCELLFTQWYTPAELSRLYGVLLAIINGVSICVEVFYAMS